MTPPIFDIRNFQNWKVKMSMHLKVQGIHVYLSTIKKSYFANGKHLEANTKVIHALKSTLNDEYLSRVSNIESAFVVWNTLISLGKQKQYYKGSDSDDGRTTSNMCYMVQGDAPLEVNSESELDEDDNIPYDDLALLCKMLLKKYDLLKVENEKLKKENNTFFC